MKLRSRLLLATIATLLAGGLLLLGKISEQSILLDKTVQSFWFDDLRNPSEIGQPYNAALADEGITLSQAQPLPIPASEIMGVDAAGKIYLKSGNERIVYDPNSHAVSQSTFPDLPSKTYLSDEFITPDGHEYGILYNQDVPHSEQLYVFDREVGAIRSLGFVTNTTRWLSATLDGRIYGFREWYWPVFVYDPQGNNLTTLEPPPDVDKYQTTRGGHPIMGEDGWLYGTSGYPIYSIFALNLTSGVLITRTAYASMLAPRPGGGVYVRAGQGLWVFDSSGTLSQLSFPTQRVPFSVDSLTPWRNGQLIGVGYFDLSSWVQQAFLFAYDPATGALRRLHTDFEWPIRLIAVGDRLYGIVGNRLSLLESGQYATTGQVESYLIRPATLVITNTVVGDNRSSVSALACGHDGMIYGAKSNENTRAWLFSFDPRRPQAGAAQIAPDVAPDDQGRFIAGTALVALDDGRLVGGTNNGHLFVYAPAAGTTWDIGRPFSNGEQIAELTIGRDGLIYGGTQSYGRATLFSFDPQTGDIVQLNQPSIEAHLIGALTAGQDGRVYAAANNMLFVYNPTTRSSGVIKSFEHGNPSCVIRALTTSAHDLIYGGCGKYFFSYDTTSGVVHDLGEAPEPGDIASLTIGSDGRIYGGVTYEYAGRYGTNYANKVFVYDPAEQHIINLGMAAVTPVALTACGNGTIYGGSNTENAGYSGPAYLLAFRTDCPIGLIGTWDKVTWQAQTPPGTRLTVDVIGEKGTLVRNIENGGSLQAIDAQKYPSLSLRANLFTSDPNVTPVLQSWRVDYTFACGGQSGFTPK